MSQLSADRYATELQAAAAVIADTVRTTDPAQRISTCPDWTLFDLAVHVGHGHRWAAYIVERRATKPVPNTAVDDLEPPSGPDAMAAWLLAGARRLADAVADVGPDARVWTWSTDHTAGFWLRKLAHDTVVHRIDADLTVGREPTIAADLATDGVSDLLASIVILSAPDHPDPIFGDLVGDGETLHLRATDIDPGATGTWLVRRTPAGVRWEYGHGAADVTVRATAMDLLLVLNRRAAPSRVEVSGNETLFTYWLEHSAF